MEFKEGLKIARKMCTRCGDYCVGCTFKDDCQFDNFPYEWSDTDIESISERVEKWAEEHTKTRLDVLKERFPFAPTFEDTGLPMSCPKAYFGKDTPKACDGLKTCTDMCRDCWNRPAPEMYQDKE